MATSSASSSDFVGMMGHNQSSGVATLHVIGDLANDGGVAFDCAVQTPLRSEVMQLGLPNVSRYTCYNDVCVTGSSSLPSYINEVFLKVYSTPLVH